MIQLTIADALAEAEARDLGMELAAARNGDLLTVARGLAYRHALKHGTVYIDDVRRALDHALGKGWPAGNWMGSIFRGDDRFVPTGNRVPTTHKGGHRREVREWRLTGVVIKEGERENVKKRTSSSCND
jgi:hypothetical protein